MFRFSSPRLLWWWVGRSVGIQKKKKKKKCKHLKEDGLLSRKAWLQRQLENVVSSTIECLNNLYKNVVLMLIKDKDITSQQLLLIKQDRMLVN